MREWRLVVREGEWSGEGKRRISGEGKGGSTDFFVAVERVYASASTGRIFVHSGERERGISGEKKRENV